MKTALMCLFIGGATASSESCSFVCWNAWSPKITRYESCSGDAVAPPVPLKGNFRQEICSNDNCTSGRIKGDWIASPGSWAWVWPAGLGPAPNPPLPCPPSSLSTAPCVNKCLKPGSYVARVNSTVRGDGGGEGRSPCKTSGTHTTRARNSRTGRRRWLRRPPLSRLP